VAPEAKDAARDAVVSWLRGGGSAWVRLNGVGTREHEHDLAALGGCTGLRGVVVPDAEDPASLQAVRAGVPDGAGVVALVESARGIDQVGAIARGGVDRLAFGSIDFALDIGAEETDEALLLARSSLVLASRVGGLPPPIDGVTVSIADDTATEEAAVRARGLGFGGKLCIHPRQLEPVVRGFGPTAARLAWATRVLACWDGTSGTFTVDGAMVDRPVLERARSIVARGDAGS
ncbi:MAG: HpcH/HpaI aldolase, partial [Marmoricola sp.]|nr:HpcH/HpaI aldolase [Marmoricola sp.]